MSIYSRTNPPQGFYIYAYLRSKDSATAKAGTPYYIGKGKGKRAISKHSNAPVPSKNCNIIIIEHLLTELGAFALERRYILWYGRKDNGTGILHNFTDGGEGTSGLVHSEETRRNISKRTTGKNNPMYGSARTGVDNPFYGQKHTTKTKQQMRSNKPARISATQTTVMAKYGVTNVQKLESVKDKGKATNIEKYGFSNYSQTDIGRSLISNTRKQNAQRAIYLEVKMLYQSLGMKIPSGTYILPDDKLISIKNILSNNC